MMAAAGPFLDINRRSQESSEDRVGMALNKGGERQAPAWLQPSSRGVWRLGRAGAVGEGAGRWDVVVLGYRGVRVPGRRRLGTIRELCSGMGQEPCWQGESRAAPCRAAPRRTGT